MSLGLPPGQLMAERLLGNGTMPSPGRNIAGFASDRRGAAAGDIEAGEADLQASGRRALPVALPNGGGGDSDSKARSWNAIRAALPALPGAPALT